MVPSAWLWSLKDKALNQASGLPGLTHFTKNVDCAIPAPACTPSASQVALFSGADFQGQCILLNVGSYSSSAQLGKVGDDSVSSIQVGSNVQATLFSKSNLQGRGEAFFANDSNLADNHIGTDTTSSLLVQARTGQPGVPVLVSPENNASFLSDASLSLAWENSGAATQYQLHLMLGTSEILLTPWTSQSFWQLNALAPGSYTWQVKARNANSETSLEQRPKFDYHCLGSKRAIQSSGCQLLLSRMEWKTRQPAGPVSTGLSPAKPITHPTVR